MSKRKKKMAEQLSFTIPGGHRKTKIENIHQHLQEVNRGCGSHDPKKYTRKKKHKKSSFDDF